MLNMGDFDTMVKDFLQCNGQAVVREYVRFRSRGLCTTMLEPEDWDMENKVTSHLREFAAVATVRDIWIETA